MRHALGMTTDEVVEYTGLPKSFWYTHADEIGFTKIARKLFWSRDDVDRYLAKHRITASDAIDVAQ